MKVEQVCLASEFLLHTMTNTNFVSTFVTMLNTQFKRWNIEKEKRKKRVIILNLFSSLKDEYFCIVFRRISTAILQIHHAWIDAALNCVTQLKFSS
jgi:uncharacterized membrane protein YqjE